MQRANYGIPPRQMDFAARPAVAAPQPVAPAAPVVTPTQVATPQPKPVFQPAQSQPVGPRTMDIMSPRPTTVTTSSAPFVATATPTPAIASPEPARPAPILTAARQAAQPEPQPAKRSRGLLPKVRLGLLVIGAVLLLGGIVRWTTAGSTNGDIIAVGAVTANDTKTIDMQFTAQDGRLHKYSVKAHDSKLIPGTAVQLAYQSGAPDATVKRVSIIEAGHKLGVTLVVLGLAGLFSAGVITLILVRGKPLSRPQAAQAVAVVA